MSPGVKYVTHIYCHAVRTRFLLRRDCVLLCHSGSPSSIPGQGNGAYFDPERSKCKNHKFLYFVPQSSPPD